MSMGGNVSLRGEMELKKIPVEKAAVVAVGAYRFDTMIEKSIRFWTPLPGFFVPFVKQMAGFVIGFNPSVEIDPARYVGRVSPIPVILVQAEKDEICDVKDARSIYRSAAEPKELIVIPDASRFDRLSISGKEFPKDHFVFLKASAVVRRQNEFARKCVLGTALTPVLFLWDSVRVTYFAGKPYESDS